MVQPMTYNTKPANYTGHPALAVPCGKVGGLPISLQLVGRFLDDLAPTLTPSICGSRADEAGHARGELLGDERTCERIGRCFIGEARDDDSRRGGDGLLRRAGVDYVICEAGT